MKVGLVCPYNIFAGGGVQECVFAIREELINRGHSVYIITPKPRSSTTKNPPDGVRFVGHAAKLKSFHTTAQISASADNDVIDSVLQEYDFDILHFHEPWVPFVSRQILSRSNTCNVATFHAKLPENRMNRTIEKVITPYTKSIIKYLHELTAVSSAASDYIASLTYRDIAIIPNGIDLKKYTSVARKPKASSKAKTIVFIGRLERRKGVMYLIKAFEELVKVDKDVELHIAGAGPDTRRLRSYVEDYGIERVTFHGYVSEQKKIELMRNATVLCSPALYGESFGIVLLEAMALGVPIVAGDNPGYRSVMKQRGSLSIINPKDTASFMIRLQLFLDDDAIRKAWIAWSKKYVKQFSYKHIVDSYEDMYKRSYGEYEYQKSNL
ncbi:MAG: glycosyltransferase family 4 protein, partial [Actinobacteria bacterium]|nr:glycosyltransferase family 4 protein [Actinomycetota bacterium]